MDNIANEINGISNDSYGAHSAIKGLHMIVAMFIFYEEDGGYICELTN
jgi:hypothetical protein